MRQDPKREPLTRTCLDYVCQVNIYQKTIHTLLAKLNDLDVRQQSELERIHLEDDEKEREKERDGDAKKKSGSARRTSTRARVPGTGDEARRRKRRDAG